MGAGQRIRGLLEDWIASGNDDGNEDGLGGVMTANTNIKNLTCTNKSVVFRKTKADPTTRPTDSYTDV